MIYFLLPTLIILLCLSYRINQKDIGAPAVIFTLSFCFCSLWATVYSKEWSLELEMATYLVIVLGVADFILTSYLYRKILKRIRIKQKDRNFKEDNNTETWKIIIFIGIEVLSIICTIICLKKMTGSLVLASAIAQYRDSIVFGNVEKTFPKILTIVRIIVNGSGYWFAYIFANKLVSNRKINIFVLIALLLSVINTLILGGRNEGINIIMSVIIDYYMIYKYHHGWNVKIKFKSLIKIVLIAFAFLLTFQQMGNLLGRKSSTNLFYYIAVYCGAQIKNLDSFILSGKYPVHTNYFGEQTFINLILWMQPKINDNFVEYSLDLPFKSVNGLNLGNVYTTFYSFIYDFGYCGEFILTSLMAIISQNVYYVAQKAKCLCRPSIIVIVYSYIFSTLLFSFFSNKFYEQLFTPYFPRLVILWMILNFIFYKLQVRKR